MRFRLLLTFALAAGALAGRTYVVDQRHANANDHNAGSAAAPLATIDRAAKLAQPGDTVLVHAGVYRERVAPARGGLPGQPITYTAAAGERVYLRGSVVFTGAWRPVKGARETFSASLRRPELRDYNPFSIPLFKRQPAAGTLGQVFLNGCPLKEVTRLADLRASGNRFMVSRNTLLVHFPRSSGPRTGQIEVSVRRRVFAPFKRGLGYIVVRGFVIEHCANPYPLAFWSSATPQQGALGTRAGHHWVIENNVIRYAKTIGVDIGAEGTHDSDGLGQRMPGGVGYHIIRHNVVSDNGVSGIAGWNQRDTLVLGNIVERNGTLHTNQYEEAGIKLHETRSGRVEGNLVRNNDTRGIWMDNRNIGSRVTRNVLYDNGSEGIFVELESGPLLVDRNIVCCSHPLTTGEPKADGFYMHDASGVSIERNLIFDSPGFGFNMRVVTDRPLDMPTGMVEASDNRIWSNVIVGNHGGALAIPASGPRSHNNVSDNNLFDPEAAFVETPPVGEPGAGARMGNPPPPGRSGIREWRAQMGFDEHSQIATTKARLVTGASTVDLEFVQPAEPSAGPFPSLAPGPHRVQVWPVEGIGGPEVLQTSPECLAASNQ